MTIRSLFCLAAVLAATLLLLSSHAVTLEWDQNTEQSLAGYKIYVGRASRQYYTNFIHTNLNVTVHTVSNLLNGSNFFAVTAFDTDGLESDFSDEIFTTVINRPVKVKSIRFRAQLSVQSSPTATGPWSASEDVAQFEATRGSQFYRLQLASMMEADAIAATLKSMTSGSKTGKLTTTPKRRLRSVLPPQLP